MFLVLAFFAQSVFGQTTNALPALAPAYPEMPPTLWEQHGTGILVGSFAFIALAGLLLWKLFQPKPPVILPPEIVARDALTKWLRLPEDGRLLSSVSQVLRRYVIEVFELPAAELTTTEFCAALAASGKIGAELVWTISNFLRECDERKFSAAVQSSVFTWPGPPEGGTPNLPPSLAAASRALELVERIEKRRTELRAQTPAPR